MKNKLHHQWQKSFFEKLKSKSIPTKIVFITLGVASTVWFLLRVIPKPQRAAYPCMKATAPIASSFILYIIAISGGMFGLKKFFSNLKEVRIVPALAFLVLAIFVSFAGITVKQNRAIAKENSSVVSREDPNDPVGLAQGINPGRVVWVHEPDATNENINNSYRSDHSDSYFSDKNTSQAYIDEMVKQSLLELTGESTLADAWSSIFVYHNNQRGKGEVDYVPGEKVFIKINVTSSWGGNFNTTNLARENKNTYAISETSPHVVTAVLRHLVDVIGVAEEDIYIGDPMKHIYKDMFEKWHNEFPNVHYLDNTGYTGLGREKVVKSTTAEIDYSDRGAILREGDWSSALTGDPIHTDNLYTIFEEMEYMINLPTMKGHKHAGVTMFAKNHFGSQTRDDAKHLHGGLVKMGDDPIRNEYGMYRVQVDIMGHELLGKKNLIYLMDALYCSEMEVNQPDKFQKAPWNNDWTSSIFVSQDPVAIESVGFDILAYEFDGSNGLDDFPHFGAVDDYLHQAASSDNWPEGITYDPENDGSVIESLGVHEHWNNPTDMEYSRNLGIGDGIELLKVDFNFDYVAVTEINVTAEVDTILVTETLQLSAAVLPVEASNLGVTWTLTGNKSSATIDKNGLLTAVSEGKVNAVATAKDGSTVYGSYEINIVEPVSIEENSLFDISLYPNPATSLLNLSTNGSCNYAIYNISGQLALQGEFVEKTTINIDELKAGVYFVKISSEELNESIRFIKE